jgi:hypothetical protein
VGAAHIPLHFLAILWHLIGFPFRSTGAHRQFDGMPPGREDKRLNPTAAVNGGGDLLSSLPLLARSLEVDDRPAHLRRR